MRLLESQPEITQRELAVQLGVSLGRANYCLQALVGRGWVKIENFSKSDSKMRYAYWLTPAGAAAKTRLTIRFLKQKIREYEELREEISELEEELSTGGV